MRTKEGITKEDLTEQRDWAGLYRSTGLRLWRAIYAYSGGQRSVADDAVAEAFARAIQHDENIRRPESWLFRTAFRIAAADLREQRSRDDVTMAATSDDIDNDLAGVMAALRGLSANQRAAVYLFYVTDLPIKEVAQAMDTSAAAVKVHLHRGRNRLRELLSEENDDA